MRSQEWAVQNEFNSFNTFKIIKHLDHWAKISIDADSPYAPPPIAVTIDPSNCCNMSCVGCNAQRVMQNSSSMMSAEWMKELPEFLNYWGVKSVTLAGGGEPLLSPHVAEFMSSSIYKNYELGLITNGSFIDKCVAQISLSTKWVGVSVDAGTKEVYAYIKNTDEKNFKKVLDNVAKLANIHKRVTYKFLINKHNIVDIYESARLARELGCCAIHLRPIGATWYDNSNLPIFSGEDVDRALDSVGQARQDFETSEFKIFGVTHKFDKNWQLANCFEKCWACFMYLVIEPNGVISTCCDNRGNPGMQLATGVNSPWDILKHWGSAKHVEMFNNIDVSACPRCTFSLHNQCYEKCILDDQMDINFI